MAGTPPLPDAPPIGRRLRMRRDALGMTAQAVADRAGITASQLSRIEHGRNQPTWHTVDRLFRVLGVTLKEAPIEDNTAA